MPYGDDYDPRTDPPGYPVDAPEPDARSMADEMRERLRRVLLDAEHDEWCIGMTDAEYVAQGPDGPPVVMCGCGVFAPVIAEATASTGEMTTSRPGGTAVYEASDPIKSTLALIDPTQVYTPQDVELHILDVLYRLEVGALFERETIQEHHRAQQEFDMAYQKAIHLSGESSADKRKAAATVACETQANAAMQAKMLKDAAKATMHNLRAILTGYQSVGRSIQSAYQGGGSQGASPQQGSYRR